MEVRLPGVTGRLGFIDSPGYVADRPMEVLEVPPPSVNTVSMVGVTVEYYSPRRRWGHEKTEQDGAPRGRSRNDAACASKGWQRVRYMRISLAGRHRCPE